MSDHSKVMPIMQKMDTNGTDSEKKNCSLLSQELANREAEGVPTNTRKTQNGL